MSYTRRERILELVSQYQISTQQQLADLLKKDGFDVTQATVSRDIRELNLIKTAGAGGRSCYGVAPKPDPANNDRFVKILRETVLSVEKAENLIVVKTMTACANAVAEAIDTSALEHVIGTLAGDNTVLIIVDTKENTDTIIEKISEIMA